jgi:hypothetical protein
MLSWKLQLLPFAFCLLSVIAHGQDVKLEHGRPIEREIAGSQSHTCQIELAARQFARFRLEQRAIDVVLSLTAPDGKQMVEVNLTRPGAFESLSMEAQADGRYPLEVRGNGSSAHVGAYRLEVTISSASTPKDMQRLNAEALLREAHQLSNESGKDQHVLDKLEPALALWQELGDGFWEGWALQRSSNAYNNLRQPEEGRKDLISFWV